MSEDEKRADASGAAGDLSREEITEAEIVEENASEPPIQNAAQSASATIPPRRRRGVIGPVIGGVLAAAAGFGLARAVPGGWPVQDTAALEAEIAAQSDQIAKLKSDYADIVARPVPPDTSQELATLRAGLEEKLAESSAAADPSAAIAKATDALQASIASIDARLTEIEKRPVGPAGAMSATALAAYDRELQALRDQIAGDGGNGTELKAQIESIAAEAKAQLAAAAQEAAKLKEEAAASARQARIDAAIGRIEASLEAGGPFASAVAELGEAGLTVPPELSDMAEIGLPTLADLRRQFPDAARAALDAALRSDVGDGWGERVAAFLRTQTGARSLEPREGTDPDAILSRAQAALEKGDLDHTLTEIVALPEPAQAPLKPWLDNAHARMSAAAAIAALSAAADTQ